MRDPLQIVFILDVDKEVAIDQVRARLPSHREGVHILKLSEYGAPIVRRHGDEKSPVDWTGLALAVVRMVTDARKRSKGVEAPSEHYIAGHAPLAVFVHLSAELSAWAGPVTVINPRKDGTWAVVPLTRTAASSDVAFFDIVSELPVRAPSDIEGRLAVFISCGLPPLRKEMRALVRDQEEQVGEIIEIRTSTSRDLNDVTAAAAAQQLQDIFSKLRGAYPDASGLAIFIAGPAQLAAMVGRALNPTIHQSAWIADFDAGLYELAFSLPWRGARNLDISQTGEAKLRRQQALGELNAALSDFREQFGEEDLPPGSFPMTPQARQRFLGDVQRLKPLRESEGNDEPFQLEILEDALIISPGLLEALALLDEAQRKALGQVFILHELFHVGQDLRSVHYHGIGRAGFALEEIDYWADAFALGVLGKMEVRNRGPQGLRHVKDIVTTLTHAVLKGLAAFDRLSEGDTIERLSERRLRRYLIWHLQHSRAETITAPEHIWELFGARLLVELAPLEGGLNAAFDKIARKTLPERTELFIVLEARLLRETKTQSFDPDRLINAIRTYDIDTIQQCMRVVRTKHERDLVPWRVTQPEKGK
jgi:hypothetical protein